MKMSLPNPILHYTEPRGEVCVAKLEAARWTLGSTGAAPSAVRRKESPALAGLSYSYAVRRYYWTGTVS